MRRTPRSFDSTSRGCTKRWRSYRVSSTRGWSFSIKVHLDLRARIYTCPTMLLLCIARSVSIDSA
jgi:hypothetical protein